MATRNIVPRADGEGKLGTAEKKWGEVNAVKVTSNGNEVVTGPASAVSGNIPVFDGTTGKVIKDSGIALNPLTSDVTITVGSGGDFPTINAALEYAVKKYYPIFLSGGTKPRVTIQLQAGFVMAEQVLVEGLDLSWITIIGADAETMITRSALTKNLKGEYPAFGVLRGALPFINQLFNMDSSGDSANRDGIFCYQGRCSIGPACGIKNAASYGLLVSHSSIVNANNVNMSGAGYCGICASTASTIDAGSANISGSNLGIYALDGSTINAKNTNASETASYGICIASGSIINATSATGTLNVTANTLTSNGIIFQ